jgi:hypothetical protein
VTDAARPSSGAVIACGHRVLAAWLAALTLLNVFAALRHPSFDQTVWLIDLRPLGQRPALAVSGLAALALLAWAIAPQRRAQRIAGVTAASVFAVAAVLDVVGFYRTWGRGEIAPSIPVPLSVLTAAAFVAIGLVPTHRERGHPRAPAPILSAPPFGGVFRRVSAWDRFDGRDLERGEGRCDRG